MTEPASALFPLFRSRLLTNIVTEIYLNDGMPTVTGLADKLGVNHKNVSQAVDTLVAGGIVSATKVGRSRQLSANREAPFYDALLQLLTIVQGPPALIASALRGCDPVRGAYIFGSWAARATGAEGDPPRDIDVLILSEDRLDRPDRRKVFEALEEASLSLKRPVNPVFASIEQWESSADAFLQDLRNGALIPAVPLPDQSGVA